MKNSRRFSRYVEKDGKNFGNRLVELYSIPGVDEIINQNKNNNETNKKQDLGLFLREPPISCTSVKFNNVVVLDPSLDEEEIADSRLTVATDQNGDIRAMQKGLNGSFTREEIQKVIKASIDNGKEIRNILYKSTGK